MVRQINQRIENTDLYIFSRDEATGLFTYSRPIESEEGNLLAGQVSINGGLRASESGVLYNMSTLKGIDANRKLMKQTDGNVWFPTISEGLLLHDAGLLPSGELMDFGIAVYNAKNPDKEIAQTLVETAGENGYDLPVLASFKSLDLSEGGEKYGLTPVIASEEGLILGDDARKTLERFLYVGNSGVRRLYRGGFGDWYADWGGLDGFDGGCRVGRVSAVGSAKNLMGLVSSQVEQNYNAQREALKQQIQSLNEQERKTIASAEGILGA